MDKKEYITNQFKKTFGKKYENYCITRIYRLLNRLNVQNYSQKKEIIMSLKIIHILIL